MHKELLSLYYFRQLKYTLTPIGSEIILCSFIFMLVCNFGSVSSKIIAEAIFPLAEPELVA